MPFYIYAPGQDEPGMHVGKMAKVFAGLGSEMFTDADTFHLEFPDGADSKTKTNLIGATFMINQLYFEGRDSKNCLECALFNF